MDFALTGTDISIIITYNSLCQLGEPFRELTMRYICRLQRISYNNRDTARNGCFSLRKLWKEFGPYSGFVMALKEIIASPHRRTGRGGGGWAAAPPNFGQLRFFGPQEKIWAKLFFKDVSVFFY